MGRKTIAKHTAEILQTIEQGDAALATVNGVMGKLWWTAATRLRDAGHCRLMRSSVLQDEQWACIPIGTTLDYKTLNCLPEAPTHLHLYRWQTEIGEFVARAPNAVAARQQILANVEPCDARNGDLQRATAGHPATVLGELAVLAWCR